MDILIATKNVGKYKEIHEMLYSLEADIHVRLLSLNDLKIEEDCVESGANFEENAILKAKFYGEKSGLITVADDSGIFVEALKDELGVKTRRWGAGETATDEEWLNYFMQRMSGEKNRKASFICFACVVFPSGSFKTFFGETKGTISETIETPVKTGIPLSSVFKPDGLDLVYSALSVQDKNKLSHRGKAFLQLKDYVKGYLTKN